MSHAPTKKSDSDEDKIVPPDGGWGWLVVFASFMIHIITDGVTYSFGVFFPKFVDYFHTSNGATAWINSILVGVTLCSGPLSSAFVNKYGCRPVTIVGAILASISMMLSIFATNVFTLYITIGVGVGLGFGLIYLPAIVSVTCYFEKYRSLATGIAVCGSGLGTFVFAPVFKYLLEVYGWKKSFFIIGCLLLMCVLFGLIFRPLEPENKKGIVLVAQTNESQLKNDNLLKPNFYNVNETKINSGSTNHLYTTPSKTNEKEANGDVQKRPHSVHLFPNAVPTYQINGTVTSSTNTNSTAAAVNSTKPNDTTRLAMSQPHLDRRLWGSQVLRPTHSGIITNNKNVFYRGSLAQIPQSNRTYSWMNVEKPQEEKALMEIPNNVKVIKNSFEENESKCCGFSKESMDTLKEMLDFSLLKDPIFILFTVSNFFTSIGFNVPYVYVVMQGEKKGLTPNQANSLLSVIGIANTVGRIILGYLSDKTWINRLWVYNLCLTICGIATALSAFCFSYIEFCIFVTVFGFTIGAYVGLTSVILVDLLGLDRLTNAFGLLLLFQGLASLIGPPIVGFLYDITKSYDPGFVLAGVMIAISGLMLFVIPTMQASIERSRRKKQNHAINSCS